MCIELQGNLGAPGAARRHFREFAAENHLRAVEDLCLIVSELVSNAVLHAHPPIALAFHCDPQHVTIKVSDGGPHEVAMREPDQGTDGGRGLHIVEVLADAWGTQTTPTGKAVWATVSANGL